MAQIFNDPSLTGDQCSEDGCIMELTIQLLILFCGKEFIRQLKEVLLP
jgi:hypothetical protein